MFWIIIGIYTLIMAIVWGFFLVAKIHVYQFRTYSKHLMPFTKLLALVLLVLTVLGYVFIARIDGSAPEKTRTIEETASSETY